MTPTISVPTISVPLPVMKRILELTAVSGENSKSEIRKLVSELIESGGK